MFTFGVPLHGKSPYVKSLLLVEKKQDFVIREATKRGWVNLRENCTSEFKNILVLDYGGTKLLHLYIRVFGGKKVEICVLV